MSREENPDFYTQKGYQLRNHTEMTGAMEDYLEMICRQSLSDGYVRINFLAGRLNVRPSSASKMVYQLRDLGYVAFEKYGLIQPITVRKLDSGYYQIIAGERRWRASRLAGLTEVPERVIEADDRRTAELALVENLRREDLNPIEGAKGYKLRMEE